MKTRIYLRVAKSKRSKHGCLVSATSHPKFEPLHTNSYGNTRNYKPTVQFALDIDIPEKEFVASRILLKAKIEETKPAVKIKVVKQDGEDV